MKAPQRGSLREQCEPIVLYLIACFDTTDPAPILCEENSVLVRDVP